MTTKRFRSGLAKNDEFSDEIVDELTGKHYFDSTKDDYVFSEEIVDLLNNLTEENEVCKQAYQEVKSDAIRLKNENEQLKQRNQRQAKRLAELYELMAKKDWESLTEIIDDFCSCEEQLQREWRTYK